MNNSSGNRSMTLPQLLIALGTFIGLCLAGGLVMAAAAVPFAASSGKASNAVVELFDDLPTDVDFTVPSEQSILRAADGTVLAQFYSENRIVVSSEKISQYLKDAAVAIEDERFYEHNGIDVQGIAGAALNILSGGFAGGSTITQQYVKNALIEEGRIAGDDAAIEAATANTIGRKLNEARYAIALERKYSKDEILTAYLNIAQFGPSQWGVEAAARYFFSVPATDVTIEQAAMLIGSTQAPNKWNPLTNPEQAKQRRDVVISQMAKLGKITNEQRDAAIAVSIEDMLKVSPTNNGCGNAGSAAYFCETVVQDLLNSDKWGGTREERIQALYRGGLDITTTLNPKYQQAASEAVISKTPIDDPSGISTALTSIEPGTGKVLAMAQNTSYGNPTEESPNNTVLNLNAGQDQGGGIGFQPGSTFKIFTLVEWFKTGHSANTTVSANSRQPFYPRDFTISCNPRSNIGSVWRPQNWANRSYGNINIQTNYNNSTNSGTLNMVKQLDICNIMNGASDMGVRSGQIVTETNKEEIARTLTLDLPLTTGESAPLSTIPAGIIGGASTVTPMSMANAAATLAAEGLACEAITFTQIKDRDGNVIAEQKPNCRQVMDADVARATTQVLNGVANSPAAARARLAGIPTAGKTGTTNDAKAAWWFGYTPKMAAAVWTGHASKNVPMINIRINGQFYAEVGGGEIPASTFKAFGQAALAGTDPGTFTRPSTNNWNQKSEEELKREEEEKKQQEAEQENQQEEQSEENSNTQENSAPTVPNLSGMEYNAAAAQLRSLGYNPATKGAWSNAPKNSVVGTEPAAGTKLAPGQTVTLVVSAGPSPQG
ncbi:MAG: transglycosylase domain-containing protein [Arcanobacterium sp.]|nr:transglycosylase domain-containing protein [Arcanobacterium sp.]